MVDMNSEKCFPETNVYIIYYILPKEKMRVACLLSDIYINMYMFSLCTSMITTVCTPCSSWSYDHTLPCGCGACQPSAKEKETLTENCCHKSC